MSNKSSSTSQVISLPEGGGALHGIGEKFAPDLHTGTGNFTVPIALPPGRNGFQPQLSLVYSTGNGNGPFGLGWNLSVPGVTRKTSKGVPRYDDIQDVFILSGAEDLVQVAGQFPGRAGFRPRTEGLFALIERRLDEENDYWEVRGKDGSVSLYGTPNSKKNDPAAIANPGDRNKVFAWKLTETRDPFDNLIQYEYERDQAEDGPRHWDQLYLRHIRYADYTKPALTTPEFLVSVEFVYEQRPDPFSEYRSGFEIRTRRRCAQIVVRTHADKDYLARAYQLIYLDEQGLPANRLPLNAVSLLSQIKVIGHDDNGAPAEELPPLEFGYTNFEPEERDFFPITGPDMPPGSLAHPEYELADLMGNGLLDVFQLNGTARFWRNLGNGKFDLPREMKDAPAGLQLADPGVQLIDANGDGRIDLLTTTEMLSGYFPLRFDGQWDRRSFQRYRETPSINFEDPEVELVDLDGDGLTDVIRSGGRLECFFNDPDPRKAWQRTRWVERRALEVFPNINFSDPRVKWADMSGDGLQDIALVYDGNVEYWPNLGHGDWGSRIHMQNNPRFPYGYDPKRILVGDVDGDGLADIVYVDDTKITLWINKSGNGWSDPIVIQGTPPVSDIDAVRLVDMLGSGISGVLWSADAGGLSRERMFFHDFTGGIKPYLLSEMNNHMGAVTRVGYKPSTHFYLEDQKRLETRWKTPLPFPVQTVARVEVIDELSKGKLTTEYRYHHGYWDGGEREFRGFGMVEQLDTETFDDYSKPGLHGDANEFAPVAPVHFSAPTLSKTWFHQGPVGEEFGDWEEMDYSDEYWQGDPQLLDHTASVNAFLKTLTDRRMKRDGLRTLRGGILRTELYALDGSPREGHPYTVTESCYGLREELPPGLDDKERPHLFFPHLKAQRTTQWERGDDPMTQFAFTNDYDEFGQPRRQTQIACPRGWRKLDDEPGHPYLATRTRTDFAKPVDLGGYICDRVAKTTTYEIENSSGKRAPDLADLSDISSDLKIIGQTINFYDGDAFVGMDFAKIGNYGALVRTESLVLTNEILSKAYGGDQPPYLAQDGNVVWTGDYPQEFRDKTPALAGYSFQSNLPYATGYFAVTERRRYDFHNDPNGGGKGLVSVTRDPLGRDTTIAYDQPYQLLPAQVTDAVGLKTQAKYNYRVLQPERVTDANDNHTEFTFTPQGLLETTSVKGKAGEGDQQFPSVAMDYDFRAFENSLPNNRRPIFVRTKRRVHHDTETDVPLPKRDETIETVEYSDGFGRLLQTRTQGEEVRFGDEAFGGGESILPTKQSDGSGGDVVGKENTDSANPNVVVSGWQIYDNKGRVVEKFEPFFSEGWDYAQPQDQLFGQKATMFYDPRGQVIRTLNPDGSELRVVYGVPDVLDEPEEFEPSPWEVYSYDANDNAGRTHPAIDAAYRHHWNTPSSAMIDALGRTVLAIERNRGKPDNQGDPLPPIEEYCTTSTYDIRGNLLVVNDALGRDAFRHAYDLANRPLRIESIDAGIRRTVLDVAGNVIEGRDSKGALVLRDYDALNRPTRLWARDGTRQLLTLRERLLYGDNLNLGLSPAQIAEANLLGRLYQHFDEAGLLTFEAYDFKGNVLEKSRRVISDAAILSVFNSPPPDWKINAFRVDWDSEAATLLESPAAEYITSITYDALNRVKTMQYPMDVEGERELLRPHYNRAGALERVELDGAIYVEQIAYNAKGQRALIAYGNGVMTRHAYNRQTFRLARMRTEHYTKPDGFMYHPTGGPLQDFAYEYDLAGNITSIRDRTPGSGIPNSLLGIDALDRVFTYDPLYRLLSATGRECDQSPPNPPWDEIPKCHDVTLTRAYEETYAYDSVGNMTHLGHQAGAGGFNRDFALVPNTNRLAVVTVGATDFDYTYDANGNLIRETTSRHFEWDHSDRMRVYRTQVGNAEPSVQANYLYDATGQRVKKLVRKQGGANVEVTVYIGGIFEHHRRVQNSATQENNTLHVMDNQSRIAMARIGAPFPDDFTPAMKFHIGDHLGSSNVVTDSAGVFINREEYTPYGETSFGSFARKRYRFTDKERDEESGLYYYGARYYAPWLGRWTSADPAGLRSDMNSYAYVRGNALNAVDPFGLDDVPLLHSLPPPPDLGIHEEQVETDPKNPEQKKITLSNLTIVGEKPPGAKRSAPPGEPPQFGQPFSHETVVEIVNHYLNKAYEEREPEDWYDQMTDALGYIIEERNAVPGRSKDLNYAAADHYLNTRAAASDVGENAVLGTVILTYGYDLAKVILLPFGINPNVVDPNPEMPSDPDSRVRTWALRGLDEGVQDFYRGLEDNPCRPGIPRLAPGRKTIPLEAP